MISKPVGLAFLVVGCVGAAAAGGYLAARQNGAAPAATVTVAPANPTADPLAPAEAAPAPAVQETEAVIDAATPPSSVEPAVETTAPAALRHGSGQARPAAQRARREAANERKSSTTTARRADEPKVEWSWPNRGTATNSPSSTPAPEAAPAPASVTPTSAPADMVAETPPPPPSAPPERVYEEVIVAASSVIGLQLDTAVSSERARLEDKVEARVTRDVSVGGQVAIPAGTRVLGSVAVVEKGGKVRERARLGIRFHTLVLADGTRLPIRTETIYREGDSPSRESAAKIGGSAVGGAILGAIFGGAKGAVLGGSAGAAAGTATVMAGDRNAATMPVGTPVTVRLSEPVAVTVER